MPDDYLLLIPGLLNDGDLWRDQAVGLEGYITCEIADISQSGTMEAMAASVLSKAPARFALAGFSLGGYVAQEILRQAPERVSRLALVDSSIKSDTPARTEMRRALDKAARAPGRFHGFGERLLESYLAPANLNNPAIVSRIRDMTERLGPEVFVRQNGVERKDGRDVITRFSGPLLLLCGRHDTLTPPEDHVSITEIARLPLLKIIPNAGHMAPIEAPDIVTTALRDWLSITFTTGKFQ
jgi:pimeloyl-ACP methyl ester carboxylesterase